jgi:hypothetical protein
MLITNYILRQWQKHQLSPEAEKLQSSLRVKLTVASNVVESTALCVILVFAESASASSRTKA